MTDRGGAGGLSWLAGSLQVAGGVTLALGAVALVAPWLGCDRHDAALATVPIGLALVAWVVGNTTGRDGMSGALRRLIAVALGATAIVVVLAFGLSRVLGDTLERPSGALAVLCVGGLVALLGRLPGGDDRAALVTAKEWTATDDAVVVGVVTILAAAGTVGAEVGPLVAAVLGRLDAVSTPVGGVVLVAAIGLPSLGGAVLMSAPRGRSPVARGLAIAAFSPLLGAGLMVVAGAGPAAVAETTTMIDDRIAARVDVWQASLAVGAIGAWVGAIVASLVALGAGIRARAHGVLHDQQHRRQSVLMASLLCSAVVVLICVRLEASLTPPWSLRPALSAGVFAAMGVMAVHMGAAALGDVRSPLQHRAGGYVASAAVSSIVAVLLGALGASLGALCRVGADSPLDWLGVVTDAARARRLTFAAAAGFVLPVVAALIVAGHRRGVRRWAVTAARHLAWGLMLVSVALLAIALRLPIVRQAVSEPWSAAVPPTIHLAGSGDGGPCHGLHHARVVAIGREGVRQGGEHLGGLEELSTPRGCARLARRVSVSHRALTVAVDARVRGSALGCLLGAIAARGDGGPEGCALQLLALDDSGVPRCASGTLGGAGCRIGPAPQLVHLARERVVVDLGEGPARLRTGRFPEDDYLWEMPSFGDHGVALWPSSESTSGDIVSVWHRLRVATPWRAPLVYSLPPAADAAAPVDAAPDAEVSLAATVSAEASAANAIEARLWSGRAALARCHRAGEELAVKVSATYRATVDDDGRITGTMAAGGQATSSAARCLAAILQDLRLPTEAPTLVVIELHLHERHRSPALPEQDELPARL